MFSVAKCNYISDRTHCVLGGVSKMMMLFSQVALSYVFCVLPHQPVACSLTETEIRRTEDTFRTGHALRTSTNVNFTKDLLSS